MKKATRKIKLIVPLILIVLALVYIDFNYFKCKNLIESYGWNVYLPEPLSHGDGYYLSKVKT